MSDLHIGIFGPGLSGKTTLAKHYSRAAWARHGIKSICLDIHREVWGPQALVTSNPEAFEKVVWAEKSCLVFIDESSDTIARDKGMTKFFTRIRHNGHKLVVIGHDGSSLLPVMRQQLQTLALFRQSEDPAKDWAKLYGNKKLLESCTLGQHEFLWCEFYPGTAVKCKLALGNQPVQTNLGEPNISRPDRI